MSLSGASVKMSRAILGEWIPNNWDHLSVLDFAPVGMYTGVVVWVKKLISPGCFIFLKMGLEGLQAFWALFWNKEFASCLQPMLNKENLFVRARVEKVLAQCGETIRCHASSRDISVGSLDTTSGCVALIHRAVQGFLRGPSDETAGPSDETAGEEEWELYKFYRAEMVRITIGGTLWQDEKFKSPRKEPDAETSRTVTMAAPGPIKAKTTQASPQKAVGDCGYWMAEQLGCMSQGKDHQAGGHRGFRWSGTVHAYGTYGSHQEEVQVVQSLKVWRCWLRAYIAPVELEDAGEFQDDIEEELLQRAASVETWAEDSRYDMEEEIDLAVEEVEVVGLWEPMGQLRLRIGMARLPRGGLGAVPREAVMESEWVGDYVGHTHFYGTNTSYQLEYGGHRVDAFVDGRVV
eukprot:gene8506-17540_t